MKTIKYNVLKALCCSVILCLCSMNANASLINFNSPSGTNAGMVSYDGASGALVGTGIDISSVSGVGTLANAGTYSCIGCTLNFSTGILTSTSATGYTFDNGGFFEITGTIVTGTGPDIDGTGMTPLLTGSWTSQITVDILAGGIFAVSTGSGTDTKHPDILTFFNESGPFSFANTNIQLADLLNPIVIGDAFNTSVTGAIVSNVNQVPLPGAALLMGSGLIGLLGARRRRKV